MLGWPVPQIADGWVGMALHDDAVCLVAVVQAPQQRPRVAWTARHPLPTTLAGWQALRRQHRLERSRLVAVLAPQQYQLVSLEAPELPRADWADALRWRLKDVVDFPVEDAAIDVLAVPAAQADAPTRNVLAVGASAAQVRPLTERCDDAGLRLEAIDIVETSLRNLCALGDDRQRARALLWLGPQQAQLVVSLRGELLLARRIEIGGHEMAQADEDQRAALQERIALELQRTLDLCERLFSYANVAALSLLPGPQAERLAGYLRGVVYLPVEILPLAQLIDLEASPALGAADELAACAIALGAALRPAPEAA